MIGLIVRFFVYIKSLFVRPKDEIPQPFEVLNPEDKHRIGELATNLLADPLLHAIFVSIAAKHHYDWELSSPTDKERQQTAHLSLLALRDVQMQLQNHAIAAKRANSTGKYQDRVAAKAAFKRAA